MPLTSPELLTPFLTGVDGEAVIPVRDLPTDLELDPGETTLVAYAASASLALFGPERSLATQQRITHLLLDG